MRQSNPTTLKVADPQAMKALGRALGEALQMPSGQAIVVAIRGDLGAGKTTLVGGVLNGVGFAGNARSPTYTLIEPYETPQRHFFHLDLYRLADPQEVEALGLRDLLRSDAALLIEWPERGEGVLPVADLAIAIDYSIGDTRQVSLAAQTPQGEAVLRKALELRPNAR